MRVRLSRVQRIKYRHKQTLNIGKPYRQAKSARRPAPQIEQNNRQISQALDPSKLKTKPNRQSQLYKRLRANQKYQPKVRTE
jgi:hypothetical protein